MKLFHFIILLTFSNFLVQSGNAVKYDSLVIHKTDNELRLAQASTTVAGLFSQYMAGGSNKLYYLCPNRSKMALHIQTTLSKGYGPGKTICSREVQPTIKKAIEELKNDDGKQDIHLYAIGFTVNDKKFKSVTAKRQYESMNQNDYVIPMIWVYREKKLKHTIAVRYDILKTDIKKKLNSNLAETYQGSQLFANKVEQLFRDQKSKLSALLGTNYIERYHVLVLDSLINENHFIIETWKKTARYKVNQILLWREKLQMWRNIQEFVRYIASAANAQVTIYAGIGNALTVTGTDKKNYKLEWNQGEETIYIPKLYWTAVEYTQTAGRDRETTGMVIIMHNEPPTSLESHVEKVCKTNLCRTNEIWYIKGVTEQLEAGVYCCPMNAETAIQLDINFLLEERSFFRGGKSIIFPPNWE